MPTKPALFDIVALKTEVDEDGLHRGDRGTIVELLPDGRFVVEFDNEDDTPRAVTSLDAEQIDVVWIGTAHAR